MKGGDVTCVSVCSPCAYVRCGYVSSRCCCRFVIVGRHVRAQILAASTRLDRTYTTSLPVESREYYTSIPTMVRTHH